MKGIGIDIEEIKRFSKPSKRLLEKIFTKKELNYCLKKAKPQMHLAARFAVKEAVIKATGDKKIALKEIEVKNSKNGRPYVFVKGKKGKFLVSISHTDKNAVAVVVWL
ncbi:MAG: holo-ACP synthase [Elusimicrobia bacterium]|nr:holo-ACP synthase [Elusimicrobiota bacterium]